VSVWQRCLMGRSAAGVFRMCRKNLVLNVGESTFCVTWNARSVRWDILVLCVGECSFCISRNARSVCRGMLILFDEECSFSVSGNARSVCRFNARSVFLCFGEC